MMNLAQARRRARQLGRTRVNPSDYYPFRGGINQADTPLMIPPGMLLATVNYEPGIRGGYTRFQGYERFSGLPRPSEATYLIIDFDAGNSADYPSVGDTVTGDTSGATAIVLAVVEETVGTGYLAVSRVTGAFVDDESLSESAVAFAVVDGDPQPGAAADTDELDNTYTLAAEADARAQIQPVPGSGQILGVVTFEGVTYAWRANVGDTAVDIHKSSPSGWVKLTLNDKLRFDAGTGAAFTEGDTVTGITSGATAVIKRAVRQSGTWGVDAAGYLILGTVTGGPFQDGEDLDDGAAKVAEADGASATQTIATGGRYSFIIHNFYGHSSTERIYGVDGVNRGFMLDPADDTYTQIETGMVNDAPTDVWQMGGISGVLSFAFPGGSIQHSSVGEPLTWNPILGASEIAVGHDVQGVLGEVGSTTFVFTNERTLRLSGPVGALQLDDHTDETGAIRGTIQRIGAGVFLDERGFGRLAASDQFGNFSYKTISNEIPDLVNELRHKATASIVNKNLNLYRCFFSDKRALVFGFDGMKVSGRTVIQLDHVVRCIHNGKDSDNTEMVMFGSDDGYVYQMDKGRSMDGEPVRAFMRLPFHFSRSPTRQKRYRRAEFDIKAEGATSMTIGVDYSFASGEQQGNPANTIETEGGGGFWDVDIWDEFRWSAGVVATAKVKLEGAGTNIGFLISHSAADENPHTIQGVTLHHSLRRLNRST